MKRYFIRNRFEDLSTYMFVLVFIVVLLSIIGTIVCVCWNLTKIEDVVVEDLSTGVMYDVDYGHTTNGGFRFFGTDGNLYNLDSYKLHYNVEED